MRSIINIAYLCIGLMQLLFIVLKVARLIDWPWWYYLVPVMGIVTAKLITKSIFMKTFILALIVLGTMSACSQYTCATYSDVKKAPAKKPVTGAYQR